MPAEVKQKNLKCTPAKNFEMPFEHQRIPSRPILNKNKVVLLVVSYDYFFLLPLSLLFYFILYPLPCHESRTQHKHHSEPIKQP